MSLQLSRPLADWRAKNVPRVGVLRLSVKPPELWPEILLERIQCRIAGHEGATERPPGGVFHQFSTQRISQDVIADSDKCVPSPLFLLEHMVVRLMLKFLWRKSGFEMCSEEGHPIELIGIQAQAHPNQM